MIGTAGTGSSLRTVVYARTCQQPYAQPADNAPYDWIQGGLPTMRDSAFDR